MIEKKSAVICFILGAIALISSSLIISLGFRNIMHTNRTVSVRGLSEREVDADTAVWHLTFTLGGTDLPTLQKNIVSGTQTVKTFLLEHGLSEDDISVLAPNITDTTVNIYYENRNKMYDYIASQPILVRTSNISGVKEAHANTLDLLGKAISVNESYVQYIFSGLNEIKPDMIKEATENALVAAEQFARNSHSKVGKIQNATQGLFSIEDAAPGLEERKTVRVVTTVEYALID